MTRLNKLISTIKGRSGENIVKKGDYSQDVMRKAAEAAFWMPI